MGSVWSRRGAQVTVGESLEAIVAPLDRGVATTLQGAVGKRGLPCRLQPSAAHPRRSDGGVARVVYCWPEVASVGLLEEDAGGSGLEVRVGALPFMASGRARCLGETEGGVKVLADVFFFQAEDGIRDYKVTGVQTCALPICGRFTVVNRPQPTMTIRG